MNSCVFRRFGKNWSSFFILTLYNFNYSQCLIILIPSLQALGTSQLLLLKCSLISGQAFHRSTLKIQISSACALVFPNRDKLVDQHIKATGVPVEAHKGEVDQCWFEDIKCLITLSLNIYCQQILHTKLAFCKANSSIGKSKTEAWSFTSDSDPSLMPTTI